MTRDTAAPATDEPEPGPYDHLDYAVGARAWPSTEAVGRLASDIQRLTGVPGAMAIAMAVLIDQGRVADALDLELAYRTAAAADRAAKLARRGPS